MLQSGQKASTFAAIKDGVLAESLGQTITSSLRDEVDPKFASKSSAVGIPALSPIRRDAGIRRLSCGFTLRNSGAQRRAQECVGPERIECVGAQFVTLRRA